MEGKSLATKSRWQSPSKFFPVVVENFFREPEVIMEWGKSLPKEVVDDRPGVRSKQLWEIDVELHNTILKKILSCYYDLDYVDISWKLSNMSFHETPPGVGFIHQDVGVYSPDKNAPDNEVAGLIYLTPDIDPNAGTSLWNLNPGTIIKPKDSVTEEEHNRNFSEKLCFKNFFNRMIMYDAAEWHAANSKWTEGKDARLTLAFFIGGIESSTFPLKRVGHWDRERSICG